jgi:hypothetical protein
LYLNTLLRWSFSWSNCGCRVVFVATVALMQPTRLGVGIASLAIPLVLIEPRSLGLFFASFLTWTETNSRRPCAGGSIQEGTTLGRPETFRNAGSHELAPPYCGAFSRQFPDVGFSAKGNPRAGGSIRSPRIKTDRVDPRPRLAPTLDFPGLGPQVSGGPIPDCKAQCCGRSWACRYRKV